MSRAALQAHSVSLGLPCVVDWVAETGSTNADLAASGRRGAPHGTSLLAGRQVAGRGRLGRSWDSLGEGNILLSVLLRPKLSPARIPMICLATSVAVAEVGGASLGIKWPNDVLAPDGRKVAGILAELETRGGGVDFVVVGVGLNVDSAPPLPTATHLMAVDGVPRDRYRLACDLVAAVLRWSACVVRSPEAVLAAWRRRSMTLGRRVEVAGVVGEAIDVDADGALRVRTNVGVQRVLAGDVRMIGPAA